MTKYALETFNGGKKAALLLKKQKRKFLGSLETMRTT
mgnify:CR=1 FL=1